ncbi:MAG: hypothetical protein FWD87_10740 [Spirochaetaceae bacterium]|nr:hypothetical protein [Spirochaetaceae bacterium]
MYKKILFIAVIFKVILISNAWAQENVRENEPGLRQSSFPRNAPTERQTPRDRDKNVKRYLINFYLRISDHEDNDLVNSSWSRVARSGQSVALNLRANNLNIAVIFVPYFVDENSIMLVAKSRIIITHANYSGGKYYSVVDSIPLRLGEKALFFPLGLLQERIENISSCVLEIEVVYYEPENSR